MPLTRPAIRPARSPRRSTSAIEAQLLEIAAVLVAGEAEQVPAVVEELVEVHVGAGGLAEQRLEQQALVERDGVDEQGEGGGDQRQPDGDAPCRWPPGGGTGGHVGNLLGVLRPGRTTAATQSPGSRIPALPRPSHPKAVA